VNEAHVVLADRVRQHAEGTKLDPMIALGVGLMAGAKPFEGA
jgi:hypothetical protein